MSVLPEHLGQAVNECRNGQDSFSSTVKRINIISSTNHISGYTLHPQYVVKKDAIKKDSRKLRTKKLHNL